MSDEQIRQFVLDHLRDIPDFPKPGVLFKDFTPLLADGDALRAVADHLAQRYAGRVDAVVGIEARGFILGAATAYAALTGGAYRPEPPWSAARSSLSSSTDSHPAEGGGRGRHG